ncbi:MULTISPECIES: AAA family ATPase [unclassified Bradyrhizobium]
MRPRRQGSYAPGRVRPNALPRPWPACCPSATNSKPATSESESARIRTKLESLSLIDDMTLIVVNEALMTDLPTVHAIAKRPVARSRLLFVGDEAQLLPIGFGLVLHKLVQDPAIALGLTEFHRLAEATGIPPAAAAVRSGDMPRPPSSPARPQEYRSWTSTIPLWRKLDEVIVKLAGEANVLVVTTMAGEVPAIAGLPGPSSPIDRERNSERWSITTRHQESRRTARSSLHKR